MSYKADTWKNYYHVRQTKGRFYIAWNGTTNVAFDELFVRYEECLEWIRSNVHWRDPINVEFEKAFLGAEENNES